MDVPLALSLAAAFGASAFICTRRIVYALGRRGPALAPAFLASLWYASLWLGGFSGSLLGAALAAAAPLAALAAVALMRSRPRRLPAARWSLIDGAAFAFIAATIFLLPLEDANLQHPILATIRRGNLPPAALNDPSFPLAYHWLYTGSGALVSRAFGISADLALHVVSAALLAVVVCALRALSALLFRGAGARQAARVFFLLGFGPIYLRPGPAADVEDVLHGLTTQSFAEAIVRPPVVLGFALLLLALGMLLPRLPPAGGGEDRPAHPAFLLPALLALPQASEECAALTALLLALLWARGRLAGAWLAAFAVVMALSASFSGVFRAFFLGGSPMPVPQALPAWPPILLSWTGAAPLFSRRAAATMFYEWGPVFLATLVASWSDARRRACALLFVAGFAVAALVREGTWGGPDYDRFLFPGTALGFLMSAIWIERLAALPRRAAAALGAALCLFVLGGPLACFGYRLRALGLGASALARGLREPAAELDRALAAVGPREQIVTDAELAGPLLAHGFIVAAPIEGNLGCPACVDRGAFEDYMRRFRGHPRWYLLPAGDPRLSGARVMGAYEGRVLARAREA